MKRVVEILDYLYRQTGAGIRSLISRGLKKLKALERENEGCHYYGKLLLATLEVMSMLSFVNGLDFGFNFSTDSRLFFLHTPPAITVCKRCVQWFGHPPKKRRDKKRIIAIRPTGSVPSGTLTSFSHNIKPKKNRLYSYEVIGQAF